MLIKVYVAVTMENSNSILNNLALGIRWNAVNHSLQETWGGGCGLPQMKVALSSEVRRERRGRGGSWSGASCQLPCWGITMEIYHSHLQPSWNWPVFVHVSRSFQWWCGSLHPGCSQEVSSCDNFSFLCLLHMSFVVRLKSSNHP